MATKQRTYTFEKPETTIQMNGLISQFNKTTSTAKRNALRNLFDEMACEHGYIKVLYRWYYWNGIDWISAQGDAFQHPCQAKPEEVTNIKTCACGNAITNTHGWNDYNAILRCEACTERRQALLAEITSAITGKNVETVYVSSDLRNLVSVNDFTTVEISYRRAEKMAGQDFVMEA